MSLTGFLSDRYGLRWAFGGAILLMYALGIVVSLFLLHTYPRDVERRNALVSERVTDKGTV